MLKTLLVVSAMAQCTESNLAYEQNREWGAEKKAFALTADDLMLEVWELPNGLIFFTASQDGVTCLVGNLDAGDEI